MSNNQEVYAVIMAGGFGTRFWPKSRISKPKQFLDILGTGKSLIQMTYDRLLKSVPSSNILVVTNEFYCEVVAEHLPELPSENILAEPCMRNTAPCIAYANSVIASRVADPSNTSIIVAPSDHLITDGEEFHRVLSVAFDACLESDQILTMGIKPSRPDTGYGYIKYRGVGEVLEVVEFTEKPELSQAEGFLNSGDYCWNSGIFVWSLATINSAFEKHLPAISQAFSSGYDVEDIYANCESISIDYGVLEKSENVGVIAADFGWSDLGTWTSLSSHIDLSEGNHTVGADVISTDSIGNIIVAPKGKTIAIKGLNDFIVVDTEDAMLICPKSDEQWVKELVGQLKDKK